MFVSPAKIGERRPLRNGVRQSGYRCVRFATCSQFTDSVLLHIRLTLRKRDIAVSRNPLVWSLRTAPTRINSTNQIASQVPSGTTRKQVARHCYAAPCGELPTCVAVMYLTLRIRYERHGRKTPLPFPCFAAVTCRQSAPCPLREKGRFARGWKTAGFLL